MDLCTIVVTSGTVCAYILFTIVGGGGVGGVHAGLYFFGSLKDVSSRR